MCFIGLDHAGKTSILYRLSLGEVVPTQPTIGSNVETIQHKNIEFQAWDLGGAISTRRLWEAYVVSAQAIVFVVDSADTARFLEAKTEFDHVASIEGLESTPILLLANKQDCAGAVSADQLAHVMELTSVTSRPFRIQATSAVTGDGLVQGMDWLSDAILKTSSD
jgi:small GTP-binding protein